MADTSFSSIFMPVQNDYALISLRRVLGCTVDAVWKGTTCSDANMIATAASFFNVAVAVVGSIFITYTIYAGVADTGLIGAASVAMVLPAATFCLFVLGVSLARAFGPPVGAVVGLHSRWSRDGSCSSPSSGDADAFVFEERTHRSAILRAGLSHARDPDPKRALAVEAHPAAAWPGHRGLAANHLRRRDQRTDAYADSPTPRKIPRARPRVVAEALCRGGTGGWGPGGNPGTRGLAERAAGNPLVC
ncbi:MAG: hypothetical protein J0I31_05795 [Rhizobiales bacterium]|nr:hypothetical protein [Hyphomicrobiales bacterium]